MDGAMAEREFRPTSLAVFLLPVAFALANCSSTGALEENAMRTPLPRFDVIELYAPAHFGNSYEVMSADEMDTYLADVKRMGFNSYADWFTATDVNDPYSPQHADQKSRSRFEKKKAVYLAAQEAGLKLNVIICPNHVYLNQLMAKSIAAKKGRRIQGQLICPSTPRGREIILENHRNWFADTAEAGIKFNTLTAFAYDYGGCACSKCAPWILTSAELTREIHSIAKEYHPEIEPWYCSWWWSDKDHELFNAWADTHAPGWLKGMTMHIEYNRTRPKHVPVPEGCQKLAFVHIGYNEKSDYGRYGKMGPTFGPNRISTTIDELHKLGFAGFQTYSEGRFDDVNKMVLAGLASGAHSDVDAALRAYATRYLGATEADGVRWAKLLRQCVDAANPAELRMELDRLARKLPATWRIEQWRSRLDLVEAMNAKDTDRFLDAQEKLYRQVYGLGKVDHVLSPAAGRPSWAVRTGHKPGKKVEMLPEQ
jgi:hypothetical protein